MYIGLHEAFHKFALSYPIQPPWVAESLASYYGVRALEVAAAHDPDMLSLVQKFQADAARFPQGLVNINRQVQKGNWSEYGAFYTKGVVFWAAVNSALQQTRGDSLDRHVREIFAAQYTAQGKPKNLEQILHLPPQVWASLCSRFLD